MVADSIGQRLAEFEREAAMSGRHLALAFLHGESMGYIGSQRWVWDMLQGQFPVKPTNYTPAGANIKQWVLGRDIAAFVEVQQLEAGKPFHLHTDSEIYRDHRQLLDSLAGSINTSLAGSGQSLVWRPSGAVFPPSSYHSLAREDGGRRVAGALLTSFGREYEPG